MQRPASAQRDYLRVNQPLSVAEAATLSREASLESAILKSCGLTDEHAFQLAKSTSLRMLVLPGNLIGPAGARSLAQNTTLTHLDLSRNVIGSEGALYLAANSHLRFLDLRANGIRDIDCLSSFTSISLHELNLAGNPLARGKVLRTARLCAVPFMDLGVAEINQRLLVLRRGDFFVTYLTLAKDAHNSESTSHWHHFPPDIRRIILHHLVAFAAVTLRVKETRLRAHLERLARSHGVRKVAGVPVEIHP